jgi:ABC-type lipoprotein release transport system permease subunit
MTLTRLILREIRHRKLSFALSVLGVALAVGCVVGTLGLLRAYDLHSGARIAAREKAVAAEMARLEDEIRKTMKGLGFNIYIFPEGQNLAEVYAEGFASKTMPESYVTKLAQSGIVTINHLLPSLTRKLKWPEQRRTVLLVGIRGEVPLAHRDPRKPLVDPVQPGTVVLGAELCQSLGLKPGDALTFMGRSFTVAKCHSERGTRDDITIWMNLREAQELLGLPGRINAIQALECNCASVDRLGEIRADLQALLPGTRIVETKSSALARAEARQTARATARRQLAAKRAEREALRRERKRLAAALLPLVTVLCLAWVGMLTLLNARERRNEIGVLRAVGVKSRTVLGTFLGRALLAGVAGAGLGIAGAWTLNAAGRTSLFYGHSLGALLNPGEWLLAAALAPLLAGLGAWLPSLHAARRDPAEVLRSD